MINKGDSVRMVDHSRHMDLLPDGKVEHLGEPGGIHAGDNLIVIEVGLKLPTEIGPFSNDPIMNDTLLYNATKRYYICTHTRFLAKVCPNCGQSLQ